MPTPNIGLIGVTVASALSIALSAFSMMDLNDTQSEITYKDIWRWGQTLFTLAKAGLWFFVWFIIFKYKNSVLYKNQAYQKSIILFAVTSAIHFAANLGNCFIKYGKGDWVKVVKTVIEFINIVLSSFDLILGVTIFAASLKGDSYDQLQAKNELFNVITKIKSFGKDHNDEVRGNRKSEMNQQAQANIAAFNSVNPGNTQEKAFGERQKRRNPPKRRKKRK